MSALPPRPHLAPADRLAELLPHPRPASAQARLLLFTVRRIAAGGLDDAHAASALLMHFGLGFRRPLVLLRALMAELSRVSRRTLALAPCCCHRITADEAILLQIVETALCDPRGAHARIGVMLGIGVGATDCLGALTSAQALSSAFADLGWPLDRAICGQAQADQ